MSRIRGVLAVLVSLLVVLSAVVHGQAKGRPVPPAKVEVSTVRSGRIAPESEFIGTVYYHEISDVASEVSGVAEAVSFEEGDSVEAGDLLVRINADLLVKALESAKALHGQALAELEKARADLRRAKELFREGSVSERVYDDAWFLVRGLEEKAASLKADVERLGIELDKKAVRAPFDGVIVKRHVDRGEWLSPGSAVATLANSDVLDVVVEVPERVLPFIRIGVSAEVMSGGRVFNGTILSIIPRGSTDTRTFPVKIRAESGVPLMEGMEARVRLPVDESREALILPRDGVIPLFGNLVVFAVVDSKAVMLPVEIVGYKGIEAGVYSDSLKEGMKVVIKGNERLRNGQPVEILESGKGRRPAPPIR